MSVLLIIALIIFCIGAGSYGVRVGGRIGGGALAEFPSIDDFKQNPVRAFADLCENLCAWFFVIGGIVAIISIIIK